MVFMRHALPRTIMRALVPASLYVLTQHLHRSLSMGRQSNRAEKLLRFSCTAHGTTVRLGYEQWK